MFAQYLLDVLTDGGAVGTSSVVVSTGVVGAESSACWTLMIVRVVDELSLPESTTANAPPASSSASPIAAAMIHGPVRRGPGLPAGGSATGAGDGGMGCCCHTGCATVGG
jgi:hypothetical protein